MTNIELSNLIEIGNIGMKALQEILGSVEIVRVSFQKADME